MHRKESAAFGKDQAYVPVVAVATKQSVTAAR